MTDSISIYEKYNIDPNRLSRDYLKYPLKRKGVSRLSRLIEYPTKEDFYYLLIEINLPIKQIIKYFDISEPKYRYICNLYNIHKSREHINQNISNQYQNKNDNDKEIHAKHLKLSRQQSTKYQNRDKLIKEWHKNMPEEVKQRRSIKISNTLKNKSDSEKLKILNKFKQTFSEMPEERKNIRKQKISHKSIESWLNKSEKEKNIFRQKMSNIVRKSYSERGQQIVEKIYKTKILNNSFNISKPENRIFEKLISKFPDTRRQYKTQEYPFMCDFYIPELVLYIEYQGTYGHWLSAKYKEPFDSKNKIHRKFVKINYKKSFETIQYGKHKGKRKMRYISFIKQYCIKDPLKRKIAKENNLNWIEFFDEKGFDNWFNQQHYK